MQYQAVMAAIPNPAATSPVFSVKVTQHITQTTVRCQEHKFRTPESILSVCTISLHSKDVTIASRPSKLCSARGVYETLVIYFRFSSIDLPASNVSLLLGDQYSLSKE